MSGRFGKGDERGACCAGSSDPGDVGDDPGGERGDAGNGPGSASVNPGGSAGSDPGGAGGLQPDGPLATIARHRIVPVVVLEHAWQAVPLMEALAEGGLPVAEVTFRTPAAAAGIAAIVDAGLEALVGAGTVLDAGQVEAAAAAGAQFVVSPGLSPEVVSRCRALGLAAIPGAVTATEIMAALNMGVSTVKFFPAQASGGVRAIEALSAPFGDVRFIPTGGIGAGNLRDYLALPSVVAAGGSWMVPPELVAAGAWAQISRLTREAVALARSA